MNRPDQPRREHEALRARLPPWVEVDETRLSIGDERRPVAVVLGPQGERLDLRLEKRGVRGLTTDDDPVYRPALEAAGRDRPPCTVPRQRTVGRHLRGLDEDSLPHPDRVLLPIRPCLARARPPELGPVLRVLWEAVLQGCVRLQPEVRKRLWHLGERGPDGGRSQGHPKGPTATHRLEGWLGRFKPRTRLTRGRKTEAGVLNFVRLRARGRA